MFEKINKIEKHLASLVTKMGEKTQFTKSEMKEGTLLLTLLEKKKGEGVIMEYYKQLYDNKSYILNEMGKSIEIHKL